jgi:hypothetical protein
VSKVVGYISRRTRDKKTRNAGTSLVSVPAFLHCFDPFHSSVENRAALLTATNVVMAPEEPNVYRHSGPPGLSALVRNLVRETRAYELATTI